MIFLSLWPTSKSTRVPERRSGPLVLKYRIKSMFTGAKLNVSQHAILFLTDSRSLLKCFTVCRNKTSNSFTKIQLISRHSLREESLFVAIQQSNAKTIKQPGALKLMRFMSARSIWRINSIHPNPPVDFVWKHEMIRSV